MSYAVSITQDGTVLNTAEKYVTQDIVVGMSDSIKKPAATYTPGTTDQTIPAGKYLSGAQTIKGDANLIGENIRNGKSIFGVPGSLTPGITPSGTKNITANGTYDVTQFASAAVDVPPGELHAKTLSFDIASDITAGGLKTLTSQDADLAAHRTDATFTVLLMSTNGFQNKTALHAIFATNISYKGEYGAAIRGTSTAVVGSYGNAVPISELPTTHESSGQLYVDQQGQIQLWMTSSYPLRAGHYIAIASWRT